MILHILRYKHFAYFIFYISIPPSDKTQHRIFIIAKNVVVLKTSIGLSADNADTGTQRYR